MNILITGIHGITGSFLAQLLESRHKIYGIDNTEEAMAGVVRVFSCEQFDEIPPIDAVIHLAGKGSDTVNLDESRTYIDRNVGLTQCIFEWFRNSSAKQFYFLSSLKVIGDQNTDCLLTEELEPHPFGPLGESKWMAEQYLLSRWLPDKKVYILRCAMLHGKGHFFNYNTKHVFRLLTAGLPYVLGSFECRRSVTSMDNLCFVIAQMLEKDIPGGIYNVTDDGSMRSSEVFRVMGEAVGKKIRVWKCGKWFFRFIAEIGEWTHAHFDRYEYRKLSLNFVADNRKIKEALGIKTMPFPLIEGLRLTSLDYQNLKKKS